MSLVEAPAAGGDLLRRANLEFPINRDFKDHHNTNTTLLRSDAQQQHDDDDDDDDDEETSSSSIGQPDNDDDDDDNDEVQSTISLCSLDDSLPNKRGLSKFYSGKAKSFANLSEVRNVNELGKNENPFNKRRRTLMAYNLMFKEDNKKKMLKNKSFYSHSNYISMPVLPLADITDDEDEDEDEDDDSSPRNDC